MAKPESYEVQQVLSRSDPWMGRENMMVTYEFLLADSSTKWKGSVAEDLDPGLEDGGEVKGWKNEDGKFGIATGGSSNGGQPRSKGSSGSSSDPETRESIERQVAERDVLDFMARMAELWGFKRETFSQDFDFLFDKVYGRISERV